MNHPGHGRLRARSDVRGGSSDCARRGEPQRAARRSSPSPAPSIRRSVVGVPSCDRQPSPRAETQSLEHCHAHGRREQVRQHCPLDRGKLESGKTRRHAPESRCDRLDRSAITTATIETPSMANDCPRHPSKHAASARRSRQSHAERSAGNDIGKSGHHHAHPLDKIVGHIAMRSPKSLEGCSR